jgi:hypothetical protein
MKEPSDEYLVEFLLKCGKAELLVLLRTEEIVALLRWYGSNAFAYGWRKITHRDGGTHYCRILRDTTKVLDKFQKRKILDIFRTRKNRKPLPQVASVEDWEDLICALFVGTAFKNKSPEQIAVMFQEAGLEAAAAKYAAKQFGPGTAAVGLSLLVKILGKKTTKAIIEAMIVRITQERAGKGVANLLVKRLLLKVPQKTVAKTLTVLGWVLLVLDAICFSASPARRITVSTVSLISALRTRERLGKL